MIYIIVRNGSVVVSKEVYAGDLQRAAELISAKRLANPSLTYEETDELTFASVAIEVP